MKVRDLIKNLVDLNMNAEVIVSTGDTFDDVSDFDITFGGPSFVDDGRKENAPYVYLNPFTNEKKEEEPGNILHSFLVYHTQENVPFEVAALEEEDAKRKTLKAFKHTYVLKVEKL